MNNIISIYNLTKNYYSLSGKTKVLDNISIEIKKGEFVAIIGASGCGKSTLLNLLSNIDNTYEGKIIINGTIGYMLQSDALLPWLSISDNTKLAKIFNKPIDDKYIDDLLNKYNLMDFKYSKPSSLSGGMRQRIALIRTLATKPDILLLDEPFSKLDYQTKLLIENDVYSIIKKEGKTAVMVTHDIQEAIAMADRVIVLSNRPGRVKNIYDIKLKNNIDPINNRLDDNFNYYFNLIWKDLKDDN